MRRNRVASPTIVALTNNGSITAFDQQVLTENFDTPRVKRHSGMDRQFNDSWLVFPARLIPRAQAARIQAPSIASVWQEWVRSAIARLVRLSSGTGTVYWGVKLTNNTGGTITSLDISYIGEQWRNGGATSPAVSAAQLVDFQYQVANLGAITAIRQVIRLQGGWIMIRGWTLTSPTLGASTEVFDGKTAANRVAKAATITITINNGQEVWLRRKDIDHTGNDSRGCKRNFQ